MGQAAVHTSIACDVFSYDSSLSHARCERHAGHLRNKRGPSVRSCLGRPYFYVAVSLKWICTISLPHAAKVVQPCAYDRGCILRRCRPSKLVGSFCPWPGHTLGASGSKRGHPLFTALDAKPDPVQVPTSACTQSPRVVSAFPVRGLVQRQSCASQCECFYCTLSAQFGFWPSMGA